MVVQIMEEKTVSNMMILQTQMFIQMQIIFILQVYNTLLIKRI